MTQPRSSAALRAVVGMLVPVALLVATAAVAFVDLGLAGFGAILLRALAVVLMLALGAHLSRLIHRAITARRGRRA